MRLSKPPHEYPMLNSCHESDHCADEYSESSKTSLPYTTEYGMPNSRHAMAILSSMSAVIYVIVMRRQ